MSESREIEEEMPVGFASGISSPEVIKPPSRASILPTNILSEIDVLPSGLSTEI